MNTHSEERYIADKAKLNEALSRRGIDRSVDELYDNPQLGAEAVPALLDQLSTGAYGTNMLSVIAEMLFRRPLNEQEKTRAIQLCIEYCRSNLNEPGPWVELIAGNELAENIGPEHVRTIGEMLLDKRFGAPRGVFTRGLGRVGNAHAISYLRAAASDAETANWAIIELARLLPPSETIQICKTALSLQNLLHRKHVQGIRAKLERKLSKRQPVHITTETPPEGLEEWSANIDGSWVSKISQRLRKILDRGFGPAEYAEIRTAMDDMAPGDVKTLRFDVIFEGKPTCIWIQLSSRDEDAFDFYAYGSPELIRRMQSEIRLD